MHIMIFCDKFLLVGDFNAEENEAVISKFLDLYNLTNLVKGKTCFKSRNNPSCIDLFLTNVISAGMSDHHKMIVYSYENYLRESKT